MMMRRAAVVICVGVLLAVAALFAPHGTDKTLPPPAGADRIVIVKHAHTMTLMRHGHVLKMYRVSLGRGGSGDKLQAGDNKVPEGTYRIVGRNPHSMFHRSLRVGYPTPQQVYAASARGVNPGGDIMIHGIRNGLGWLGEAQRFVDWTKGCIALTDQEMDEVWIAVADGTVIEIRP